MDQCPYFLQRIWRIQQAFRLTPEFCESLKCKESSSSQVCITRPRESSPVFKVDLCVSKCSEHTNSRITRRYRTIYVSNIRVTCALVLGASLMLTARHAGMGERSQWCGWQQDCLKGTNVKMVPSNVFRKLHVLQGRQFETIRGRWLIKR